MKSKLRIKNHENQTKKKDKGKALSWWNLEKNKFQFTDKHWAWMVMTMAMALIVTVLMFMMMVFMFVIMPMITVTVRRKRMRDQMQERVTEQSTWREAQQHFQQRLLSLAPLVQGDEKQDHKRGSRDQNCGSYSICPHISLRRFYLSGFGVGMSMAMFTLRFMMIMGAVVNAEN